MTRDTLRKTNPSRTRQFDDATTVSETNVEAGSESAIAMWPSPLLPNSNSRLRACELIFSVLMPKRTGKLCALSSYSSDLSSKARHGILGSKYEATHVSSSAL